MINARQYSLLKELKEHPHFVSLKGYADIFSCSEKTISTDIKALNLVLASCGLKTRIETKRGSGARMVVLKGEDAALENAMLLNAGSAMTSYDRFYRGVLYLAMDMSVTCTVDELAAHLFTNRRRTQAEIRHWNHVLAFFGLAIKSRKRVLRLEGDEFALRTAILYFFYMVTPHYQHSVIERNLAEDTAVLSEQLLEIMEADRGVSYTRNARGAVRFYVDLAAARIRNGHQITEGSGASIACSSDSVERMRAVMERVLGVSVGIAEVSTIASSPVLGAMRDPRALTSYIDDDAKAFAYHLRDAMETRFGDSMDIEMVRSLESLVYQAEKRFQNGFPISLVSATPMKQRCLDWFITLEEIIRSVPRLSRTPLFSDDLARIATLLYPYWNKSRMKTYRAVLVADAGFEQASYGIHRIETALPFLEVVDVVSGEDVGSLDPVGSGIDFAIGFEPLESAIPVCRVSYSVDEADLMRLMKFALEIEEPWRGRPFETSFRTLGHESIRDIVQAVYWDLGNDGILKAPFEEFSDQFASHCAIATEHATTALCLSRISMTGMRIYETPSLHVVQPVKSLSVLFIAERDRPYLSEIVARFNKVIEPRVRGERSYSMPPDLSRCDLRDRS